MQNAIVLLPGAKGTLGSYFQSMSANSQNSQALCQESKSK